MIQSVKNRLDSRQREENKILDRIGRALATRNDRLYKRLEFRFGRLVARSSKDAKKFLRLIDAQMGTHLTDL
jgi:hypothetical protein